MTEPARQREHRTSMYFKLWDIIVFFFVGTVTSCATATVFIFIVNVLIFFAFGSSILYLIGLGSGG